MAKASDLRNKIGGVGGISGMNASPLAGSHNPLTGGMSDAKKDNKAESVAAKKPERGHDVGKGAGKSRGGAGSAGGRPKV